MYDINPVYATDSFNTPWKFKKTSGFLMFPGGTERDKWHEMGQYKNEH